jgi:hypothetical protein
MVWFDRKMIKQQEFLRFLLINKNYQDSNYLNVLKYDCLRYGQIHEDKQILEANDLVAL